MNKYEELRKRVYEIIHPDGIPLEFGCEVKAQRWNKNRKLSWYNGVFLNDKEKVLAGFPYIKFKDDNDFAYHGIKVLGKPLSLQDVLRAMAMKKGFVYFETVNDDKLCFLTVNYPKNKAWNFTLDLSLPISEQPEEVLDKLIELIK